MSEFRAFKALHCKNDYVQDFPMYNSELYSEEELIQKLRERKISYADLTRAIYFRGESTILNRYKKVRKKFEEYKQENIFEEDLTSIYIYEQKTPEGEIFKGIVGLISIEDFENGNVKKYQQTLEDKKEQYQLFLKTVNLQSSPVLLTYPENSKLDVMMDLEMKSKTLFQFTDEFGISHKLWNIDNRLKLSQFKGTIEKMPSLYIVEGHHKVQAAIEHSHQLKEKAKAKTRNKDYLFDASHYMLSVIMPSQSIKILEYNRLIKDLNGLTKEEFLAKLEQHFTVNLKGKEPYYPSHKHHISMYLEGEFYGLYIKHEFRGEPEGLGNLDTYLFEEYLENPILGIKENRKNSRISFLEGTGDIQGLMTLKQKVDEGDYKVGFGFYPISFEDLKLIADLGLEMPLKSTYAKPRLFNGLLIIDTK